MLTLVPVPSTTHGGIRQRMIRASTAGIDVTLSTAPPGTPRYSQPEIVDFGSPTPTFTEYFNGQ
jgi:hypothetical protein